ncbi:MAG: ABC transporter permease [Hyphomicrobiaceae bacterium]|nr:ABC transporter permease [Hyphomicrobiaceae bacterium]
MISIARASPGLRFTRGGIVAAFLVAGAVMLPFADLAVTGRDPWRELTGLFIGLVTPDFAAIEGLGFALATTLGFAIAAVAVGATTGLALAPFYHWGPIRAVCIAARSIHELFWALLLMQVYGISVATGVMAIALPYAGIFGKVFSEYLDEADRRPREMLGRDTDAISSFLYARLPLAMPEVRTYVLYRLECGIRSSAVLGFIGLPTLGFQLDTYFKQGDYQTVGAILILYFTMIGTIRWWFRWRWAVLYVASAVVALSLVASPPVGSGGLWRFLTSDIVPFPLRGADPTAWATWAAFGDWLRAIAIDAAIPGIIATLVVAQLALILTGLLALAAFPLIVPRVSGRVGSAAGHIGLVVGRSCPEYMLAYIFLQVLGPSMLPAILALGLHNGAIIAHLLGRQGEALCGRLRRDAPRGLDLYGYELVPRLYGSFLALCLYRWEIIIRESAIVGMLGVATLGFYIDNAVNELKLDQVAALLVATVLVTALVDWLSRSVRAAIGAARLSVSEQVCAR